MSRVPSPALTPVGASAARPVRTGQGVHLRQQLRHNAVHHSPAVAPGAARLQPKRKQRGHPNQTHIEREKAAPEPPPGKITDPRILHSRPVLFLCLSAVLTGASESSSSKNTTHGCARRARANTSRMFFSLSPMYMLMSSGPLTPRNRRPHSVATAWGCSVGDRAVSADAACARE